MRIVSRADVLQVFVRSDEGLRREILEQVIGGKLAMASGRIEVTVRDAMVVLKGGCQRRSMIPLVWRRSPRSRG